MATKQDESKFSIIDLFKGGIPNPAGYPIPRPSNHPAKNMSGVAEKSPDYKVQSKTEKK